MGCLGVFVSHESVTTESCPCVTSVWNERRHQGSVPLSVLVSIIAEEDFERGAGYLCGGLKVRLVRNTSSESRDVSSAQVAKLNQEKLELFQTLPFLRNSFLLSRASF